MCGLVLATLAPYGMLHLRRMVRRTNNKDSDTQMDDYLLAIGNQVQRFKLRYDYIAANAESMGDAALVESVRVMRAQLDAMVNNLIKFADGHQNPVVRDALNKAAGTQQYKPAHPDLMFVV